MLTRNSLAWWLVTAVVGCSSSTSVDTPQSGGGSGSGGATSGGGSGGASGSGGTAGTGGAAPDPGSCEHYCQTIAVNCEAFPQYPSDVTCIATCELWELGMEMDRSGNSRACRLYHANAARVAPETHCRHAGPAGVGTCGTSCEGYCTVMLAVCPETYEDSGTCTTECELMTNFDAPDFVAGVEGDHFQCRLYHSTFAAGVSRELHCPHAGPVPTGPCSGM